MVDIQTTLLLMLVAFCLVGSGAILGAWLTYRGRHDVSPMPSLPQRARVVKPETRKPEMVLPEVKA